MWITLYRLYRGSVLFYSLMSAAASKVKALISPAAPQRLLLLSETSQKIDSRVSDSMDPKELQYRAVKITFTLKQILERPGYMHGGLND